VQTALSLYKVPIWPYDGAVAIQDGHHMLVINKWCYLGTAKDSDELAEFAQSEALAFDLDIYKIVKKAMTGSHKANIIKLAARQSESDLYDAS
jgi:DNA polymerase-3 subunit epsilon